MKGWRFSQKAFSRQSTARHKKLFYKENYNINASTKLFSFVLNDFKKSV